MSGIFIKSIGLSLSLCLLCFIHSFKLSLYRSIYLRHVFSISLSAKQFIFIHSSRMSTILLLFLLLLECAVFLVLLVALAIEFYIHICSAFLLWFTHILSIWLFISSSSHRMCEYFSPFSMAFCKDAGTGQEVQSKMLN